MKLNSLRDLPQEVKPARDLWPQIEARLSARGAEDPERLGALAMPLLEIASPRDRGAIPQRRLASSLHRAAPYLRLFAAVAALGAAVAVGISIGRGLMSVAPSPASLAARDNAPGLLPAYLADPSYMRQREALMRVLNARLASLPPQSRQKVLASLATIHQSMQDIQAALGREPGNALLQELLIDTYQDEMRVLTTVQEASAGGET